MKRSIEWSLLIAFVGVLFLFGFLISLGIHDDIQKDKFRYKLLVLDCCTFYTNSIQKTPNGLSLLNYNGDSVTISRHESFRITDRKNK